MKALGKVERTIQFSDNLLIIMLFNFKKLQLFHYEVFLITKNSKWLYWDYSDMNVKGKYFQ